MERRRWGKEADGGRVEVESRKKGKEEVWSTFAGTRIRFSARRALSLMSVLQLFQNCHSVGGKKKKGDYETRNSFYHDRCARIFLSR